MKQFTIKHRIIIGISLFLILLISFCLYQAFLFPLKAGITVGGLEVGGLSPAKARQKLEAALEKTLLKQELAVHLPEETLLFSPEDCDFRISITKTILAARHAEAGSEVSLLPYLEANEETILKKLEAYAAQYERYSRS